MLALAVNCGSSSLRFAAIEIAGDDVARLAAGTVERIGPSARLRMTLPRGSARGEEIAAADHAAAAGAVARLVRDLLQPTHPEVIGHRVVHGGRRLRDPVLLDESGMRAIDRAGRLAPLHNAPALRAIEAMRREFPDTPQVAAFDTSFHAGMPDHARLYAIPRSFAASHEVRRYGFHGLAHEDMARRAPALVGRDARALRLVTLQLGSGCSAAAIEGGRSVDTSMGFTPLEGLMMATRSGDVDPSLVIALARSGLSLDHIEDLLNRGSGLQGVSGLSGDVRALVEAEAAGHEGAALALEMFCYRVSKQIGAYAAALGGLDAVVFGGGIGEHQPALRRRICARLAWAGLQIDEARNEAAVGGDAVIHATGSTIAACVVAVDEAVVIARAAVRVASAPDAN